jgi:hypothetical protein
MDIQSNRKAALLVTAMALGFGTAFAIDAISNAGSSLGVFVNSAQAAEGHDSGSSGGHSGGKGSDKGGSSHSSGGHDSGSTHGGTEEKGHGTKMKHQGHSSGSHASGSSHGRSGSERFGGGSGLSGNAQVPDGVGRYGDGAPAASAEGRTRYWGGWTLPGSDDPVPDTYVAPTASVSSSSLIPGSGGGPTVSSRSVLDGPTRCEGVVAGMPAAQQFGGGNLLRLNAARGLVDPQLAASGKIAPPYVMGSLQQELIKSAPNAELAGTYLGLIAKAPVTADTVKKISRQVCGSVSDAQAKEIAEVAETQRQTLTAASEAAAKETANQ